MLAARASCKHADSAQQKPSSSIFLSFFTLSSSSAMLRFHSPFAPGSFPRYIKAHFHVALRHSDRCHSSVIFSPLLPRRQHNGWCKVHPCAGTRAGCSRDSNTAQSPDKRIPVQVRGFRCVSGYSRTREKCSRARSREKCLSTRSTENLLAFLILRTPLLDHWDFIRISTQGGYAACRCTQCVSIHRAVIIHVHQSGQYDAIIIAATA